MNFFSNSFKILTVSNSFSRKLLGNQNRNVKNWVSPTLKELKRRRKKLGDDPIEITKRSNYIEWNYNAELFAFSKRLKEEFDIKILQQAFINRSFILQEEVKQRKLDIKNPEINLKDNQELIKKGEALMSNYVTMFLEYSLPKVPFIGIKAFYEYLTSEDNLAYISANIGIKDLILSADYPCENKTLADSFKAVIGALYESSGEEKCYTFVRDFICTHLNQKELFDIWKIENPLQVLEEYCKENKLDLPEPRLIGEIGKNTVLAAYHVGIYLNKILIGTGYGESVNIAVNCAALNTLKKFYDIEDSKLPFDFEIEINRISTEKQKLFTEK